MLTENDVVKAVARYLVAEGYRVDQELSTIEQGIDIDAVHRKTGKRMLVEAKGATSSKEGTSRFGKPFSLSQATVHVSRAFYSAAKLQQKHADEGARVAIALPDDASHRALVEAIGAALEQLQITVYLVNAARQVSVFSRGSET